MQSGGVHLFAWLGILVCLAQAAIFSGLNLAVFSVSRLRLELEAAGGNADASRVLGLRTDAHLMLATILWGNVAANVLLTLLSKSVLAGVGAFLFSTIAITLLAEILPQAYFSRHALRIAALFKPMLDAYRVLLFPVAKPTAVFLDRWLGREGLTLFRERDIGELIARHAEAEGTDIDPVEGTGARNFLDLDDVAVCDEGEPVDPRSIIGMRMQNGQPSIPVFESSPDDPFLRRLNSGGKKWVILTDESGQPRLVLDAHHFLRDALFSELKARPQAYWHKPIVVTDMETRLGEVIGRMRVEPEHPGDDVIDHDIILVWGQQKRIITGADLLGRLLRGIARREGA